jgi:hypothetical protein
MFVEEVNLNEEFAEGSSDISYPTYKKKFAVFLSKDRFSEWLTDENVEIIED